MSRQETDGVIQHRSEPTVSRPSERYPEALEALGGMDNFVEFLQSLVMARVINAKEMTILTERAQGKTLREVGERMGVPNPRGQGNIAKPEKRAWGKIFEWMSAQYVTFSSALEAAKADSPVEQKLLRPARSKTRIFKIEPASLQSTLRRLGSPAEVSRRIEKEKQLGSEFITLLANIMGRLAQGGEYDDIVRDVQKMEVGMRPERAEVLIRNAIDYFLLFPSPTSETGSEQSE